MISSTPAAVVSSTVLLALVFAGCNSFSYRSRTIDPDDWVTSGATLARTSLADRRIEPPLEKVWDFDVGAGTGPGSVLVAGDLVLVANRKGQLLALDAENGRRVGRVRFGAPVEGGMAIAGTMLLVPGAKRKETITGFDLVRGKEAWKLREASVEAGVLALDSLAVAIDAGAILRVVDAELGQERWTHALDSMAHIISTPAAEGAVVYAANEDGVVFAVDVVKRVRRWRRDLHTPVLQSLSMGSSLVIVPTTRGRLFGLDARTGETRWTLALPDTTVRFSSTAVDPGEGVLIVGATDGSVRAIHALNGTELWSADVGAPVTAAPLLTHSTVYVGTLGRQLIALDRNTGLQLWEYEMPGRVQSAMAASDDMVFVLSEPQRIHAFRIAEEAVTE
jgi:PQQ-like domain